MALWGAPANTSSSVALVLYAIASAKPSQTLCVTVAVRIWGQRFVWVPARGFSWVGATALAPAPPLICVNHPHLRMSAMNVLAAGGRSERPLSLPSF